MRTRHNHNDHDEYHDHVLDYDNGSDDNDTDADNDRCTNDFSAKHHDNKFRDIHDNAARGINDLNIIIDHSAELNLTDDELSDLKFARKLLVATHRIAHDYIAKYGMGAPGD